MFSIVTPRRGRPRNPNGLQDPPSLQHGARCLTRPLADLGFSAAIAVVEDPHREVGGALAKVLVVEDAPEEVGGDLSRIKRAVDDEGLLTAHEVVKVVAGGLLAEGAGLFAVDVVDQRLSGVNRIGIGERLAETLVEEERATTWPFVLSSV